MLHLGGTNIGKTYAGFQRLRRAETGVYLAPLRLLALEARRRCWRPAYTAAYPRARRRIFGTMIPTLLPQQKNCPWSSIMMWL